jgi:hypothetical protein
MAMKSITLLEQTNLFPRLLKLFPEFVDSARSIEVIPWQESFQIADRNPQVIDTLEFYGQLLRNGLITKDQHDKYVQDALSETKGIISRTEGIAFISKREISFRSPNPHPAYIVHEIGHVHYSEPDPIWSATYGGGEALMQLALWDKYTTDDRTIRRFHQILHDSAVYPQQVANQLAHIIAEKTHVKCYPNLYAFELFAGTIPSDLMDQLHEKGLTDIYSNFDDPRWSQIQVSHEGIRMFLIDLIEGVKWQDPFYFAYAKALELIRECPACNMIICKCQ